MFMGVYRRFLAVVSVFLFCATGVWSGDFADVLDVKLWEDGLPNSNGHDGGIEDVERGIYSPEMRVFFPSEEVKTGRVVVACPGGGYSHLALGHEGYDWAPFFNELGITYVVLKYRMPFGCDVVPLSDLTEAMRVVRSRCVEWGINPLDVGVMGSSAGGHLAAWLATNGPSDARPDFQILFYPVISMERGKTHEGSVSSLLGAGCSDEERLKHSCDRLVHRHRVSRAIVLVSCDDAAVPVGNSVGYVQSLTSNGIEASLHVYPSGGHGWGFRDGFVHRDQMLNDLRCWLECLDSPDMGAVRVACVGNSITDGHGILMNDMRGYPALLGDKLGSGFCVRNFGISGYTLLQHGDKPYRSHESYDFCKSFEPDVVVVKLGTNDSKAFNWVFGDEFKDNARCLIEELRCLPSHPRIIIAYPIKAFDNQFQIRDSVIAGEIIPLWHEVALEYDLEELDLYSVFEGHEEYLQRDGVHPNDRGVEVIAEEVKRAILRGI